MRYELTLFDDGDIEIVEIAGKTGFGDRRVVYHKSFNLLDDLEENLLEAYKKWEELKDENRMGSSKKI